MPSAAFVRLLVRRFMGQGMTSDQATSAAALVIHNLVDSDARQRNLPAN